MLSLTLLFVGVLISNLAYITPPTAFNLYQAAGSAVFWAGALLLAGTLLLGNTLRSAVNFGRTWKGVTIGGAYLVVHLLLYGFILEGILVLLYGITPFVSSSTVYLSSDVLYPASLANALVGMAFSPSINILLPPYFEASLSFFSVIVAVVIDVLILANIARVSEIGGAGSRFIRPRAYLLMPLTGVLLGASCCMSLPLLLSIISPSLEGIANLSWAFYLTYFLLPPFAIVLLKFNLGLASRIEGRVVAQKSGLP